MNPVIIEPYDPQWPEHFKTFHSRLAPLLDGMASAIEHVGSTAVPGLSAKPIIDIDVLLRLRADLPRAIAALASAGYHHRGDLGITGREAFRAPPLDFSHHLYVCLPNSREFQRHLSFRDYLRIHPQDASVYAALKRELASKLRDDREAYNDAKSHFVEEILRRVGETPNS